MKKYFEILRKCSLFEGIEDENLIPMLGCIGANVKNYRKSETVFAEGGLADYIGIVLSGLVQIERTDYYGNRSIATTVEPSELFGESFACAGVTEMPVSAIAKENSEVMLIDCNRIISPCSNACSFHSQMISNILKIVATKNIFLNQKTEILSRRSTREKLMAFLMQQAKRHNSNHFTIPYDRQALADFLAVDRSGLSAEISKLRDEGIIKSRKSEFIILKKSSDF